MTPEELRADIPALDEVTYLNTGASGPSPRRVVEAAQSSVERHAFEVPAGDGTYPALFDALDETRSVLADHFGTDAENVALTQSTTDGIGRVAAAMDWSPGDVVVRTDQEHAAGILPWQRLRDARDVEVRVVEVEHGEIDREAFAEAVDGARLAVFSSLCWTDGSRLPVAELTNVAHDAGARVLVDAVQSVGQRPVDLEAWGADAVAAAGHKWLLGPSGAGFLYVAPDFAPALEPAQIGFRGLAEVDEDSMSYELHPDARRFETSTVSPAPYAALRESIATIEDLGYDAITTRIERLTDRLKEGLDDDRLVSTRKFQSGLVAFEDDDPEATAERLDEAGIVVRDIPGTGTVRASLHAFNSADDVDELLDAL